MNTKDRILQAALRQFNAIGTGQATVRSIAAEAGISHGNLCYHYKNTDELIEALYLQLAGRVAPYAQMAFSEGISLEVVFGQAWQTFGLLYQYRFLLIDFVQITRRLERMKQNFQQLMDVRRQQFLYGFKQLEEQGEMKPEPLPGHYELLITNLLIVGNNWISEAEVQFGDKGDAVVAHYHRAMMALFVPYLTPKGLRAYQALTADDGAYGGKADKPLR